jgi:spermidine dehydrogenase
LYATDCGVAACKLNAADGLAVMSAQKNNRSGTLAAADDRITRRDFLNGAALVVGGAASGALLPRFVAAAVAEEAAAQDVAGYYPPALTGLRGDHQGSFETAHALRDGDFWRDAGAIAATGEDYDLVVVGGGISGLAAAHFYRAKRPDARILILDNHDDVGGHAKRNEFAFGGRLALMNGGTYSIDSPRPYSSIADGLLRTLGIDPVVLTKKCAKQNFYESLGLAQGVFFDRATFGADKLVVARKGAAWGDILADAPVAAKARRDIVRIEEGTTDYFPGLSSAEKKARLSRMSYRDYLRDVVKADAAAIAVYQDRTHGEWGVGIEAVSALDVWAFDFPGFKGLGLESGSAPRMGYTAAGYADGGSYTFHFPDGNASIARLLVRALIPQSLPGTSAEDIVAATLDYARLDRPQAPVRIRLNATAVRVRHVGDPSVANGVEIVYARGSALSSVRARGCVLACYNMAIPYLCPEMPDRQKEALHYASKIPLIYVSIALRNWQAFKTLGVVRVHAPGSYFSALALNEVVDIGAYASARSPDEPVLVHMTRVPVAPGMPEREQHRAGRRDVLSTSFETFERAIRDQLDRMLGPGGFDAARDITAITVNRWPHGYAYEYNPLFDPDWPPGEAPHVIGRARFGRITIANSDAGAAAYTDSAIDQAHRAVTELLGI